MRFDGRFVVNGLYINYDKSLALQAFTEANSESLDIPDYEWEKHFSGWVFVRLETKDGETVGAAISSNGEGHIGILKPWRGKWGGSESIKSLCKYFGVHKTCAFASNKKATSMLDKAGFVVVSHRNGVNYYELKR